MAEVPMESSAVSPDIKEPEPAPGAATAEPGGGKAEGEAPAAEPELAPKESEPAPRATDEHPSSHGHKASPEPCSSEEAGSKDVPASKAAALRAVTEAVEAAPFPCIASDWEEVEMCCIAMNDHYVEHMKCPREMLMNRNNRVLDPTHYTKLPGKIRLGIRSAMCYGYNFNACLESVKTADRGQRFMKSVSMRTIVLDRHRFIIGWQHTMGDAKTYGRDSGWWKEFGALLAPAAAKAGLEVRWVGPEEAARWDGCEQGAFVQTESLCRKERLDEVVARAVAGLPFPALVCDPFLPECPVLALSGAARALTGWAELGTSAAEADKRLLEGARGAARGAYHLNYGRYGEEDSEHQERLAVRAACCNGRPCLAKWRGMYEQPSEDAPCMWLQGATLAQGVNSGPLSGCDVWYLLGILGDQADPEAWRQSAEFQEQLAALRSCVANAITPQNARWLTATSYQQEGNHPYGGDVKLLQLPLWHGAVHS